MDVADLVSTVGLLAAFTVSVKPPNTDPIITHTSVILRILTITFLFFISAPPLNQQLTRDKKHQPQGTQKHGRGWRQVQGCCLLCQAASCRPNSSALPTTVTLSQCGPLSSHRQKRQPQGTQECSLSWRLIGGGVCFVGLSNHQEHLGTHRPNHQLPTVGAACVVSSCVPYYYTIPSGEMSIGKTLNFACQNPYSL